MQTPTSSQITNGITLWASNFKKPGYGFAGWNTSYDYSGTNYGPNQTITAPSDIESSGLSLYAIWVPSAGDLQNWNGCSSLNQGDVTALKDSRDNNVYAVAKLADNKCWMIENLRLDNTPELTSANTHNPSLPLNNSWYYRNQQSILTTSNHLSAASNPGSTNLDTIWCSETQSKPDCFDQSMLATNNTAYFTTNQSSAQDSDLYSYGNYYNWYSATAGHGTYSKISGNTTGDICPAGWHLPTGGSAEDEFGTLDVTMGGTGAYQSSMEAPNRWRSYPNNFIYSGAVGSTTVDQRGSSGYYWSSSAGSDSESIDRRAYSMVFFNNFIVPGTATATPSNGFMVRCVAGV